LQHDVELSNSALKQASWKIAGRLSDERLLEVIFAPLRGVAFPAPTTIAVAVAVMMIAAAGGLFGQTLVLRHRIMFEDLALEDPDLDAASPIGGVRGGDAIVDIGA
jgi:hypothetical protein